ncbi:MAG: 4-oxalocrotonate tautomerase family protein [Lentisphaeria bacterium]|nr:4-oxalocrotonate tautomerase family protein [Candidatus Neomarinimicrobiota bacterium]MCF7841891.1 4-oxalocrotonate tautomerase family protein [Lentisphaeria bacterium]
MPFVNIRVAGTLTKEQKVQIAREVTALLERIANKPPEATLVVIEEVSRENWAKGGTLLADR